MAKSVIRVPTDEEVLRYGRARKWPPIRGGADFRLQDGLIYAPAGMLETNSQATTLVSGAANGKGSWTQLVSSVSYDATGLMVFCLGPSSAVNQTMLVDIGIGPSGSEAVLIPNLMSPTAGRIPAIWHFPISVSSGSRISARSQSSTAASQSAIVGIGLISEGLASPSGLGKVVDYGTLLTSSHGTSISTSSPPINSKSVWVEITPSTPDPMEELALALSGTGGPFAALWDIGIGPAGSEQVVLGDIPSAVSGATGYQVTAYSRLPLSLPAGTRIIARSQTSTTATGTIIVYGVN